MQSKALPGFRDLYPADTALLQKIFDVWRAVSARYGFEEYGGPPLEPLELYTAKSGEEIVGQLYHFEDKGGRAVALRPDMTPTLARMVAAKASDFKKPIRWYTIPQLFRYERQQRGRFREHHQFNLDVIGEVSPLADAEVIAVAIDALHELGLGENDFRVLVSDRSVVKSLLLATGVPEEQLGSAYAAMDKVHREKTAKLHSFLLKAGMQKTVANKVLDIATIRGLTDVNNAVERVGGDGAATKNLSECVEALDAMGLGRMIDIDCSVVRGLAYYTGIVFELFDSSKSLRAICGGGRYDGLLKVLGGVDLPAVGFGMGDVVVGELLKERGLAPLEGMGLDVFVVGVTPEDVPEVMKLARSLRGLGLSVEYPLRSQALGKQLKLGAARNARTAIIIGPEERSDGKVVVRNLATGSEERVELSKLTREYLRPD